MRKYFEPYINPSFLLVWSVLLCLLLSGCNLLPGGPTETIQEPPLIPDPATDASASATEEANRKPLVLAYADLMDFNDLNLHHPKLHEAVSTAIKLGVLKPASLEEKFEPQNPIRFGEFRKWTIAYQGAATGMDMLPLNPPEDTAKASKINEIASAPAIIPGNPNPMSPISLMILPSDMQWGEHRLGEMSHLTREELCAIYTFLSRQDATARALSAAEIESANPQWKNANKDAINLDEALSQFKDYPAIGNWARRYVAIAYRDGMLQKILGLTPTRLTIDDGLNPQKEVTRGEAIVLLHHLFSQAAMDRQTLKPVPPKQNTKPGSLEPVGNTITSTPAKTEKAPLQHTNTEKPMPVSQMKAVQETGPNGSRNAIRVSGPD